MAQAKGAILALVPGRLGTALELLGNPQDRITAFASKPAFDL